MSDPEESALETVRRVAELARLELGDEEALRLAKEFGRILEAFGSLRALAAEELEGAAPRETDPGDERLRADEPRDPAGDGTSALEAAPERIDDFFGVPRTLGGET